MSVSFFAVGLHGLFCLLWLLCCVCVCLRFMLLYFEDVFLIGVIVLFFCSCACVFNVFVFIACSCVCLNVLFVVVCWFVLFLWFNMLVVV